MAEYRICVRGLAEQDVVLLKSLLKLGQPLLRDTWVYAEGEDANVILVDRDHVPPRVPAPGDWHQLEVGLLSAPGVDTPAPFLKKPLRLSPLVALLNGVAREASSPKAAEPQATPPSDEDERSAPPADAATGQHPGATTGAGLKGLITRLASHGEANSGDMADAAEPHTTPGARESLAGSTAPRPLLITTPRARPFHNPAVELGERHIRQWIEGLPLLNLGESVRKLLSALQPLNEEPLSTRERLRVLEVYRHPLDAMFQSFDALTLRQAVTSTLQRKQVVADMGRLYLELANGYKMVVAQSYQEGHDPARDTVYRLAILRAMEQLVHALVHTYQAYAPLPPRLFLEIHQLYRCAEEGGVRAHRGPMTGDQHGPTLETLYKQAMLFSVSDPYRLAEGQAPHVFRQLGQFAERAVLSPLDLESGHDEGVFFVNLERDAPAMPLSRMVDPPYAEASRMLDSRPVLEAVFQAAEGLKGLPPSAATVQRRRMLAQLANHLRSSERRSLARRQTHQEVRMLAGIETVHDYLLRGRSPRSDSAAQAQPWIVLNENARGFMLASLGGEGSRVGDLVAVIPGELPGWTGLILAVTRWMRHLQDSRTEVGVELMPGEPLPVLCDLPEGEQVRCLFLTSGEGSSLPPILLAPKGCYSPGARLTIRGEERAWSVKVGSLLHEEACFDQFEVSTSRDD